MEGIILRVFWGIGVTYHRDTILNQPVQCDKGVIMFDGTNGEWAVMDLVAACVYHTHHFYRAGIGTM